MWAAVRHVPAEPVVGHGHPPELGDHVLAPSDLGDVALPILEDRVALVGIRPTPIGVPNVVEHDHGLGYRTREREELTFW